jgi:NADPH:quinone reductase-like Zn-dependent oxidoreductase
MRAARFHSYGAPDVLVVEDAPEPHASERSVRIKVQATSVNPIDVALRAGHLAQFLPLAFPAIPGRDAVGVVDEVGPGVTDTQVRDTDCVWSGRGQRHHRRVRGPDCMERRP